MDKDRWWFAMTPPDGLDARGLAASAVPQYCDRCTGVLGSVVIHVKGEKFHQGCASLTAALPTAAVAEPVAFLIERIAADGQVLTSSLRYNREPASETVRVTPLGDLTALSALLDTRTQEVEAERAARLEAEGLFNECATARDASGFIGTVPDCIAHWCSSFEDAEALVAALKARVAAVARSAWFDGYESGAGDEGRIPMPGDPPAAPEAAFQEFARTTSSRGGKDG